MQLGVYVSTSLCDILESPLTSPVKLQWCILIQVNYSVPFVNHSVGGADTEPNYSFLSTSVAARVKKTLGILHSCFHPFSLNRRWHSRFCSTIWHYLKRVWQFMSVFLLLITSYVYADDRSHTVALASCCSESVSVFSRLLPELIYTHSAQI